MIVKYQKHMEHVDRVDKNVILTLIRLMHCVKRYHRALSMWLLAAVGFNNVLVLFLLLFPLATELQKKWNKNVTGFKH